MKVREQVLLAENQTFREKLESLDLTLIAYKLMHPGYGQGWTRQQVDRAIVNYKRFLLLLYLYPNSAIVPTQEIDQVWHQHILDTRKYAQDCQWLFGYFLHHYPYFGMESDSEQYVIETAFSRTQTLFAQHFGIDLNENSYHLQDACGIVPKSQPNQPSACIELKQPALNYPSACIELSAV
jgi:hypothetical protein